MTKDLATYRRLRAHLGKYYSTQPGNGGMGVSCRVCGHHAGIPHDLCVDLKQLVEAELVAARVADGEAMLVVESLEYKFGLALARIKALEDALERIAQHSCEHTHISDARVCPTAPKEGLTAWCLSCYARAALEETK